MLDPYLFFAGQGLSYSLFVLNPLNIASSTEILERVRRIEGVKGARIDLMEERVELYGALLAHLMGKASQVAVQVEGNRR